MKVQLDLRGDGNLTDISGLTLRSLDLSGDVISSHALQPANGWQTLMPARQLKSARIGLQGVVIDPDHLRHLMMLFLRGGTVGSRIWLLKTGSIKGDFQIVSTHYATLENRPATLRLDLQSSGEIIWLPTHS